MMMELMGARAVPDYYPTMYLDGYEPWEILNAVHKTMYKQYQKRTAAEAEDTFGDIKITSEVRVK